MPSNIFNSELVELARRTVKQGSSKKAFVDAATATGGGDPAAAGGMPPGGDPMAAAGGMPPGGDPMAAAGGDPMAAAGGMPPGDPRIDQLMSMMQQMMSQGGAAGAAGGAAGGVEPIKPKIDVNIELMQIKKMLAKICDQMGIAIPASDMVATSADLTQMAMQSQGGAAAGGAGAGGAPPTSAISPIAPMQPAMPSPPPGGAGGGEKKSHARGTVVPQLLSMRDLGNRASALATILRAQRS